MTKSATISPPAAEGMPRLRASRLRLAAFLLLFTLLVRAISFVPSVINPDESVFALAAREVLQGHLLYLTLFDNKPVGSTLLIALAFKLFGQSVFSVRLLGSLAVWISAILLARLAEQGALSRLQALFAGLLYVAFASTMGGFATLTEILLTPFTIVAVLLLFRALAPGGFGRRLLLFALAGLACGGAIAIKIVPLVPGFAAAGTVLLLLLVRRELRLMPAAALGIAFALGSATPMLTAASIFAAAGALPEFFYSNFGFASAYADIHPSLKVTAERLATVIDSLWPLLALAAFGATGLFRIWRRRGAPEPLLVVAAAWLLGEIVAASASRHFWPHYFLSALPPLALIGTYGIRAVARWFAADKVETPRAILFISAVAVLIPVAHTQMDTLRKVNRKQDVARAAAAAIRREASGPAPTLFVTNYQLSALYALAGSPLPPTRYAIAPHLLSRQSAMIPDDPRAEVARVLASRPEFIVMDTRDWLPPWARTRFDAALQGYRELPPLGTVRIYRRLTGPAQPLRH